MTEIILVRHGQSYSNVERRLCARPPGPGLTPRGQLQAAAASRALADLGLRPTRLFSSPMRRALETAFPFAERFGVDVEVRKELTETGFGDWEGRFVQSLVELPDFQSWQSDPDHFPPPGGEPLSEIADRMTRLLRRVAARHDGETIVAFSHMHPILSFVLRACRRPLSDHDQIEIPNAAVVRARFERNAFSLVSIDRRAEHAAAGRAEEASAGG